MRGIRNWISAAGSGAAAPGAGATTTSTSSSPCSLGTRRAGGYASHVLVPHPRYVLPYDGRFIPCDVVRVAA